MCLHCIHFNVFIGLFVTFNIIRSDDSYWQLTASLQAGSLFDKTRSTLHTSTRVELGTARANQFKTQAICHRIKAPHLDANVTRVNLAECWGLERDETANAVPAWTKKL